VEDIMNRLSKLLFVALIFAGCSDEALETAGAPVPDGPSVKSGVVGIKTAPESWWYDLGKYPHDSEYLAHWTSYQWRNQLNIRKDQSASLVRATTRAGAKLHNWDEGNGYLVTDFHGVEVKLPGNDPRKTPRKLLELIRDNPAMVGGGPTVTDFTDEVTWPSTYGGKARQPGDVVFLNLWGPDNAAIVYIDTDVSDRQFCVMTATHSQTGWHPVNGVRCWGYIDWNRDGFTHLFYTTGVDSTTISGSGWVGGSLQFEVWRAQMAAISRHVECIWGGDGGYMWQDDEVQEWFGKAPGQVGIADIDHLGDWDAYSEASAEYEYDCRHSELMVSGGNTAPEVDVAFDDKVDSDGDGVPDTLDLCSATPAGKAVWGEGEWIGCAAGQRKDV